MIISDRLREQAEASAVADYEAVVGKETTVHWIYGYDENGNSVDLAGPWVVRVDHASKDELTHWNYEFLDPYWNVTPVDDCPELKGMGSFWTHGVSYGVWEDQVVRESE